MISIKSLEGSAAPEFGLGIQDDEENIGNKLDSHCIIRDIDVYMLNWKSY